MYKTTFFKIIAALQLCFSKSSYEVRLSYGTVNICLEAVGPTKIAPGVIVPVELIATSGGMYMLLIYTLVV